MALNTPRLWNYLRIDVKTRAHVAADRYPTILEFWAKNAAALPLALEINADYKKTPQLSQTLLSAIPTVLHLLRKLHLSSNGFELEHFASLFSHPLGSVPLLEDLLLDIPYGWNTPIIVFQSAPRLRKVFLDMHAHMHRKILYSLPWAQLNWLDICDVISPRMFRNILRDGVTLEHGSFVVHFAVEDGRHTFLPIQNDTLVTLLISAGGSPDNTADLLLSGIKLSALRNFELTLHDNAKLVFTNRIGSCLQRLISQSSFRSLVLGDITADTDVFTSFLSNIPSVERLAIDCKFMDFPFICERLQQGLSINDINPCPTILPTLTEIHFAIFIGTNHMQDLLAFRSLVSLRSNAGLRHVSFYMRFPPGSRHAGVDWTKVMQDMVHEVSGGRGSVYAKGINDLWFNLSVETVIWYA